MAANEDYAPSKDTVNAVVRSSEKLEGAAKLILMLEDKAGIEQIRPQSSRRCAPSWRLAPPTSTTPGKRPRKN